MRTFSYNIPERDFYASDKRDFDGSREDGHFIVESRRDFTEIGDLRVFSGLLHSRELGGAGGTRIEATKWKTWGDKLTFENIVGTFGDMP